MEKHRYIKDDFQKILKKIWILKMKLIQDGKKDPAINEQDGKFIKTCLRQCIATKFITESEKEEILNYLETTEEADLTVPGLISPTGADGVHLSPILPH
ncbi:MAG: hypothetical protein OXU24_00050 [Gammaproteobacteria bacterium]|nr:hypothetical protein [Gammaproteobacteria bacterium]